RVELLEERARLTQWLARRQLARLPPPDPRAVVAGEDDVRRPVLLAHLPELERARHQAVVAEQLVQRLRRERQKRRQHDLKRVDAAEADVEDRRGALAIALDRRPRRLAARVLVDD